MHFDLTKTTWQHSAMNACELRFAVSHEEHEFNFRRNLLDHLSVITQLLVALIRSMFDFIPGLCIQQTAVFFSAQSLIPRKHKNPKSWQM